MRFESSTHIPFDDWTDKLPDNFSGKRLPGGTLKAISGEFGYFSIQEYKSDQFSFVYEVSQLNNPIAISYHLENRETISLHSVLSGSLEIQIEEEKNKMVPDSWYFVTSNSQSFHPTLQSTCERFSIIVDTSLFKSIEQYFKTIDFKRVSRIYSISNTHSDRLNVDNILRCLYPIDWLAPFYKFRVGDLIFSFMVSASKNNPVEEKYTKHELEQIYKAERIITSDISAHIIIPELAKKVGMNDFRFKAVFKMIFDMGPYEYLREKRLQKAIQLLDNGELVKVAAIETGWRVEDLIYAYKSRFGTTPGRRKK